MVGIEDKNGANQNSCYKYPLRTKVKVHFEPRFGGRPWVFGGEVEHSLPTFGSGESPSCCWGKEGLRPRLEIRWKLKPSLQLLSTLMEMREEYAMC